MIPIKKPKYCLNCGEEIMGRTDKMFCKDSCRNTYNNKQNKDVTNLMRNTNNKLRKNYRILTELNPNEQVKVTRQLLKKKGFDFDFCTNVLNAKTGKVYRCVYDQSYTELEEDMFLIIKQEV